MEALKDPCSDRQVATHPPPPACKRTNIYQICSMSPEEMLHAPELDLITLEDERHALRGVVMLRWWRCRKRL